MSLQSNVNQLISIAGMLYSQTPKAAAKREKAQIKAREEVERETLKSSMERYEQMAGLGQTPEDMTQLVPQLGIAEFGEETARRMFELDPSEENLKRYQQYIGDAEELRRQRAGLQEEQRQDIMDEHSEQRMLRESQEIENRAATRQRIADERTKQRQAEEQARARQQAEQERLARSAQLRESILTGTTPENMGVRERYKTGGNK